MMKRFSSALAVSALVGAMLGACDQSAPGSGTQHDTSAADPYDSTTWCSGGGYQPPDCANWCNNCGPLTTADIYSDISTIATLGKGDATVDTCVSAALALVDASLKASPGPDVDPSQLVGLACDALSQVLGCTPGITPPPPIAAIAVACATGDLLANVIQCGAYSTACSQELLAASPLPSPSSACSLNNGSPSPADITNYCMQHVPGTDQALPWPTNVENAFQNCVDAWMADCGLRPPASPSPTPDAPDMALPQPSPSATP